jgi:hypothetical protein
MLLIKAKVVSVKDFFGRNLEFCVTLTVAVWCLYLDVHGLPNNRTRLEAINRPITLIPVILGLLAFGLIRDRDQREKLSKTIESIDPTNDRLTRLFRESDDINDVLDKIESTHEVWIWGSTLTTHLPWFEKHIRNRSPDNPLKVRLLLTKIQPQHKLCPP